MYPHCIKSEPTPSHKRAFFFLFFFNTYCRWGMSTRGGYVCFPQQYKTLVKILETECRHCPQFQSWVNTSLWILLVFSWKEHVYVSQTYSFADPKLFPFLWKYFIIGIKTYTLAQFFPTLRINWEKISIRFSSVSIYCTSHKPGLDVLFNKHSYFYFYLGLASQHAWFGLFLRKIFPLNVIFKGKSVNPACM